MPAFAFARDAVVVTRGFGPVTLDIGYGGAFYAVLPAAELGLDLGSSPLGRIVEAADGSEGGGRAHADARRHPDEPDLAFLYGTILTDGGDGAGRAEPNICVFADGQVDRSPTGSGVTARLALHAPPRSGRGRRDAPVRQHHGRGVHGRVMAATRAGPHAAVVVEVAGEAYYHRRGPVHGSSPTIGWAGASCCAAEWSRGL